MIYKRMAQLTHKYFTNFELAKLDIMHYNLVNILIIVFFFLAISLTIEKQSSAKIAFLDVLHTQQLRGFAILFVVLGHLWVHVSKIKANLIFSGEAVSLFLIISGFGLSISSRNKRKTLRDFFSKRIKRVMYPYWISTIMILILDLFFLKRSLHINNLILTLLGINLLEELLHFDYVRWFVTFILLWYFLFFIFIVKLSNKYSELTLLLISIILIPINYYILNLSWYQFMSFPAGCLLASNLEKIKCIIDKNKHILHIAISGILYVITYKTLLSFNTINKAVADTIPNILLLYISEWNSLVISISTIFILWMFHKKGLNSRLLLFLGKYSYEIFLVHGVFLIKYNPFIKSKNMFLIIVQFYVLLLFVSFISIFIHKLHTFFHEKDYKNS